MALEAVGSNPIGLPYIIDLETALKAADSPKGTLRRNPIGLSCYGFLDVFEIVLLL